MFLSFSLSLICFFFFSFFFGWGSKCEPSVHLNCKPSCPLHTHLLYLYSFSGHSHPFPHSQSVHYSQIFISSPRCEYLISHVTRPLGYLTGCSNSPQAPPPSLFLSFSPSQYLKPPSTQVSERKSSLPNPSEL